MTPSGWKVTNLDELATIRRGASPRPINNPKWFAESGPGWVRISDVTAAGKFLRTTKQCLSETGARASVRVSPGDLIMSICASIGKPIIVDMDACIHDGFVVFAELSDEIDKEFLYQFLLTRNFGRRGQAGTQSNINTTLVGREPILLPLKKEQQKIVSIATSWDQAIEGLEKLLAAKQQRKQALMQQLLTGKKRFPEFKGWKWQTVDLGDVFTERTEINRPDLPLVAITSDRGVISRDELDRSDTSSEDKSKYLRIAPGDIGYNTMRMWQGVSGVSELEGIVSPAYTVCIPQPNIDRYFAGYLFKFRPVIHLFHSHSQGLVKDTLNLKFQSFAWIKVTLPPIDEQRKIAAVLKACDRGIAVLQREAAALRDQKKGLMQQLLTGKVRVG